MPKKPDPIEKVIEKTEEVLVPFSVVIDGQDRTILAKDEEDLQRRIARLRST